MGIVTRGVAFVVDAAVIDLVAVVVTAAVALIVSIFHLPPDVQSILKAVGLGIYLLWAAGYFVGFWSATGQTPGDRLMQIRVVTQEGERVKPRRGILRCIGLVAAALPLFAGYVPILFDKKRRGFPDWLAKTVVVDAPGISLAQASRERRRAAKDAARATQVMPR